MAFENLTPREQEVLKHLVDHYVATADPVGSRAIATQFDMGLSSATIRNTMQDLEDMGYISQPHTSAGRIPTDRGYRIYVDNLLSPEKLSAVDKKRIQASISDAGRTVEAILGQSTRILADIAQQMGVAVAPKFEKGKLTRLQLVPLSSEKMLVVLVVKSGLARSLILEVEANLPESDLALLESILNERLNGLTLGEIRRTVSDRLQSVGGSPRLLKLFIDPDSAVWNDSAGTEMHVMGTDNLLSQPEFSDQAELIEFMRTVEDHEKLLSGIPDSSEAPGVVVRIGGENTLAEMRRCSVVSAKYKIGHIEGRIAVVGPTRMRYSKLLSIVEYAAQSMSASLSAADKD